MCAVVKSLNWDTQELFGEIIEQIRRGRSVFIQAKGWSMFPLLWDRRDQLELSPLDEDSISLGRVLLFQDPATKHYIIHRLERIERDMYIFRGDGNPYQWERCQREHIFAEVRMIIRNGKEIHRQHLLWQCIEKYWPKNSLLRRGFIGMYRRLFLRKKYPVRK